MSLWEEKFARYFSNYFFFPYSFTKVLEIFCYSSFFFLAALPVWFSSKFPNSVYFRTVQHTHINKDPPMYAATSPHTDAF